MDYLIDSGNTVTSNLTAIVAWCGVGQTDIYEVESEEDFNNCENLLEDPVTYSSHDSLDGFIVHNATEYKYFVSKSKCNEGFKLKIRFK